MQSKINNDVQFGQSLNPLNDVVKVSSVFNSSDLKDTFTKTDKLCKLWKDGSMDFDLSRFCQECQRYFDKVKFIMRSLKSICVSKLH